LHISFVCQIDREKYLLLAYDWHYRAMTGSGILDHYNPNVIDVNKVSIDHLLSAQSIGMQSLTVQKIFCNLSELQLKQKSCCQVTSVFRSSSSKVSLCRYGPLTLYYIPMKPYFKEFIV